MSDGRAALPAEPPHRHPRRPQHAVRVGIAGLELGDHGPVRGRSIDGHDRRGVVPLRIERLSLRRDALEPEGGELAFELALDEPQPLEQRLAAPRLVRVQYVAQT